jgi:activating signal cointegrator complex subunit 2
MKILYFLIRLIGKKPGHYRHQADDDEEEEEEDNVKTKRNSQFVENPEAVRARWAQQRAAWQQRQQPHRTQTEQTHDVVGNARGRGQTGTVAHNRRWKDAHKSSQGNHNRRRGAAFKANRGLLS